MVGTTIAHYKVTSVLGQGGMGVVYRARDTRLDREVAIKVLPKDFANDPERVLRFEREAKALARLSHPNIAAIYGFDRYKGEYFLVLELVEGDTLAERLAQGGMTLGDALAVFQEVAQALSEAHGKGIVHRDLKPANIKIATNGQVKVLDFGLAKAGELNQGAETEDVDATVAESQVAGPGTSLTEPGRVMGTVAYMSPEQSRGEPVDRRTDVWAFACCLYECLCGRKPFCGRTSSDVMAEVLKSNPDLSILPQSTPAEVISLLRRAFEKDQRRRPRDLGDIALALKDLSDLSSLNAVPTGPESTASRMRNAERNPKIRVWGLGLIGIGLVAAIWSGVFSTDNKSTSEIRSVTVQLFENLNETDKESQYLTTTLQQALKEQLGNLTGLSIKATGATEVDATIRGTYLRLDQEFRVTVSLLHEATENEIPLGIYTSPTNNIFPLQNQIALAVVQKIEGKLSASLQEQLSQSPDASPAAYIAFRKGVDALDVAGFENVDGAIQYFQQAIQADPRFLAPYLQQAWAHWWPTIYGTKDTTASQAFQKSFAVLEAARLVFPEEPMVEVTREFFRMVADYEFRPALVAFDKVMLDSLNEPDLDFMRVWYAILIEARYTDAMLMIDRIIADDPERIAFQDAKAEVYSFLAKDAEALALNSSIAEDHADDFDRLVNNAFSLKNLGELDAAMKSAQRAVEVSQEHPTTLAVLAEVHAARGETEAAEKLLERVEGYRREGWFVPRVFSARAEAELGNVDEALALIEAAYAGREGWSLLYSMRHPEFMKKMSGSSGFWALVHEMGYPELPLNHPLREYEQRMRVRDSGND